MKITLQPRKTIRVPFLRSRSKVRLEHKLTVEYLPHSIKENEAPVPVMRYCLSDIQTKDAIPPSEMIVLQKGIPVMVTTTKGTPGTGKLESAWMSDPLLEVSDKVAGVKKLKQEEKRLSARVIERYVEETVVRALRISNKTGRPVNLLVQFQERPSDGIFFNSADPKPTKSAPPEHDWELQVPVEGEKVVTLNLTCKTLEKIELPPDRPAAHAREVDFAEDEAMEADDDDDGGEQENHAQQAAMPRQRRG